MLADIVAAVIPLIIPFLLLCSFLSNHKPNIKLPNGGKKNNDNSTNTESTPTQVPADNDQ